MKNKKHKKEKKQKKAKRRHKDDTSEESSGGEMEWIEAPSTLPVPEKSCAPPSTSVAAPPLEDSRPEQKAEDWLASPFLTATTSLADIRKKKEEEKEKEKEREKNRSLSSVDKPGYSARELNPYWKDGGTGLPEEERAHRHHSAPVARKAGAGVDGGVGWLKKSFRRAVEQAKESGRSVEQVVADRWGSMAEYKRLLAEAEAAAVGGAQGRSTGTSRGPSGPPPGWKSRREDGAESHSRGEDRDRYRGDQDRERYRGARDADYRRDKSEYDRSRQPLDKGSSDRSKTDRGRGTDSDASERERRREGSYGRDRRDRGFMKPGDRDGGSRDLGDLRSKFKRPGDDNEAGVDNLRMDRSSSGSRERGVSSSSRDRRDDDVPKWKKGGFRKPGDHDGDSDRHSTSRSYTASSSSSSSGGWRKAGFKKPGEGDSYSASSQVHPPTGSSSTQSGRKPAFQRPSKDEEISRGSSTMKDRSPLPTHFSSGTARERRKGSSSSSDDDDDDNRGGSDDVPSSASSSPDSQRERRQETEKERSPSPVKLLSDVEMNQLGAKLVKAEIMGNEAQLQKLKAQIDAARQARIAHKTKLMQKGELDRGQKRGPERQNKEEGQEDVILTRTDRSGQSWPLAEATAAPDSGKKKRKKNIVTHDKGGERERYFADDDDVDLETMVRREKMGSTDDHNRMLNKVASKKLALLDSEFNTLDEMFVSSAAKPESKARTEERERSRAIADHRRTMATLSKCPFCLESGEMKKHLIVALGLKVYLCVPETRCISEGQCYIAPMQHAVASTALDEDVWAEIQIFRKGLTRMFEDHEMDVCFLETCMNPKKQRHMCLEVIPVPRELGEMAPIYFKKAIQESESEWSQNKKLVDTRQKDIRRSIPRGFPYFSVDFGLDGGFAHVIEDEQIFPHYFGKEVIGGLLDVEPRLWRHPPKENFENQSKRVLQLTEWWKPFDWTQKIDREKS